MRAQGEYDFAKHEWIKRTSCIVCSSISNICFILQKSVAKDLCDAKGFCDAKEFCRGVWVAYKDVGSSQEKKFFIKFRNAVV
jgi:hypothetical protein